MVRWELLVLHPDAHESFHLCDIIIPSFLYRHNDIKNFLLYIKKTYIYFFTYSFIDRSTFLSVFLSINPIYGLLVPIETPYPTTHYKVEGEIL